MPVISFDYWYLTRRGADGGHELTLQGEDGAETEGDFRRKPVLAIWERRSGALHCCMVPTKAVSNPYTTRVIVLLVCNTVQ